MGPQAALRSVIPIRRSWQFRWRPLFSRFSRNGAASAGMRPEPVPHAHLSRGRAMPPSAWSKQRPTMSRSCPWRLNIRARCGCCQGGISPPLPRSPTRNGTSLRRFCAALLAGFERRAMIHLTISLSTPLFLRRPVSNSEAECKSTRRSPMTTQRLCAMQIQHWFVRHYRCGLALARTPMSESVRRRETSVCSGSRNVRWINLPFRASELGIPLARSGVPCDLPYQSAYGATTFRQFETFAVGTTQVQPGGCDVERFRTRAT